MAGADFAAALAAFLLSHAVPVRPPANLWLTARLGARGFNLAYSALSLAVLAWLIVAAGRAPRVPCWDWAPWRSWVAVAAMLPVCLILAIAVGRPNPFSFGGARNERFDPAHPGLIGWTRHPLLLALGLWAGAHLLANGDLAHALLFGMLGAFALLGIWTIDRRRRRLEGPAWQALRAATAAKPPPSFAELLCDHPGRVVAGISVYGALLALHPWLFGVTPLP